MSSLSVFPFGQRSYTEVSAATPYPQKAKSSLVDSSKFFVVQDDFQSELEKAFGNETSQVVKSLSDFAKHWIKLADADASKEPLVRFFRSLAFSKVWGRLRVQLKTDADPGTKASYQDMISRLKDMLDSSDVNYSNSKIEKKDGIKFWRNVGIFLALGFAIAAAVFGGYAALPVGMYICLNVAGLVAIGTITVSYFFRYAEEYCAGKVRYQLPYYDVQKCLDILLKQYGLSFDFSVDRDEFSFGKYFQKSTAQTAEAHLSNFKKQALWEYIFRAVLQDQLALAHQENNPTRIQKLTEVMKQLSL